MLKNIQLYWDPSESGFIYKHYVVPEGQYSEDGSTRKLPKMRELILKEKAIQR